MSNRSELIAPHSRLFPALETYADPKDAARYDIKIAGIRLARTELLLRSAIADWNEAETAADRRSARRAALSLFPDMRQAWRTKGMAMAQLAAVCRGQPA